MTTQDKNIAIAEMLGWKKGMLGEFTKPNTVAKDGWIGIISPLDLAFHSDANWQFEAIEWIEKQGYEITSSSDQCYISTGTPQGDGGEYFKVHVEFESTNRKEAIFEALYQFSQYLKQK